MDNEKLSKEIAISVLDYLLDRGRFKEWWDSLSRTHQDAVEINLSDRIYSVIRGAND